MQEKDKELYEVIDGLVTLIAKFNRHRWFEGRDMEELMPFISGYLKSKGIYMCPIGSTWTGGHSPESVATYLEENKNLFDDYHKWAMSQR